MRKMNHILIYFFGALGGLLFGYDTGVISGAILFIKKSLHLTTITEGLVVSAILIGAIIGSAISGPLADKVGRKIVVLAAALIFCLGAVGSAFSGNTTDLVSFRIVLGLAVGAASTMVPMYLAETAPTEIRGGLSSLNQFMIVVGILLAYIVDYIFAASEAWRWMLGLAFVPGAILFLGMLFLPESPRFLLKQGQETKAREILQHLRKTSHVEQEIHEIQQANKIENGGWREMKQPWVRPAIWTAIGLAVFQQVIGTNTVIYYAPTTFTKVGLGSAAAILGTVGIGSVQVVMTLIAVRLIDRVGRKPLLISGSIGMALSLFILGLMNKVFAHSVATGWITLICLAIYILFFSISWGPVMWVLLSEIFPLGIRGTGMGIGAVTNWVANLLVSLTFPWLLSRLGISNLFLIYGAMGVLALIFVILKVKETKGKSLEEIEMELRKRGQANAI
ncbi:sugar porter family MFS transporter [Alicyclobacillus tolerans]|uniref:Sugar porter (SP) family MFS transporter n=2 Tax=Alicyclobacillus tolerans TaxID=90970 RepID=A0ABT9LVQ0_9BACL|nr:MULTISPECIES: sugar porter family MFS transporter [Alicyclobacillus]MDP9728345.1 sugar porter (SP) family MFS transporter [Alicyclobacillus tengchongensis]SHJ93584.1 MFS transporter, sugar porter (SP) family [Alicyclobacillus montanus]